MEDSQELVEWLKISISAVIMLLAPWLIVTFIFSIEVNAAEPAKKTVVKTNPKLNGKEWIADCKLHNSSLPKNSKHRLICK